MAFVLNFVCLFVVCLLVSTATNRLKHEQPTTMKIKRARFWGAMEFVLNSVCLFLVYLLQLLQKYSKVNSVQRWKKKKNEDLFLFIF